MSIIFDKGDGSKDPRSRTGWLKNSCDHLKSEVIAIRLIHNAAKALARSEIVEVQTWCSAANGVSGAGVLRIYKGLHQHEGPRDELVHLTMNLMIPGSKQHSLVKHTLFSGAFHLYAKIVDSADSKSGHRLKPMELSYPDISGKLEHIDIPNAGAVSSELGP